MLTSKGRKAGGGLDEYFRLGMCRSLDGGLSDEKYYRELARDLERRVESMID
jgi:hypothetical protein